MRRAGGKTGTNEVGVLLYLGGIPLRRSTVINEFEDRRALVTGLGAVIAAFSAARPMRAQSVGGGFSPARHDTDRWMDQLPGKHRVFVDSAGGTGGEDTLRFAGNLFTVNRTAYGVAPADLAIIICYRHNSTPVQLQRRHLGQVRKGLVAAHRPRRRCDDQSAEPGRNDRSNAWIAHLQRSTDCGVHDGESARSLA